VKASTVILSTARNLFLLFKQAGSRSLAALWMAAVLMLASPGAIAQTEPEGFPDPGAPLFDPDFKVRTRQFGLDRRVEMYQWRLGEDGYERVWHGALIDSAGFDSAHTNPSKLPIENRRWWAENPTLDGAPLDQAVLRSLGEWRVLRPNFSRLPANLSASFQPEGEGLGSAENPLEPAVGDVRVSWRELVLPPLAGKVIQRSGTWVLVKTPEDADSADATEMPANTKPEHAQRVWPFFAGGLLLIAAIVVAVQRRRKRHSH
jgi:hypothetical protein